MDGTTPITDTAATATPPTVAPRKRKRRAPATGATEDCFTCRNRKTTCDRRRPYCTQCIEIGKDCSGYKTTLTWGVGVASRGKLRGKTLPIANAPKAAGASRKQGTLDVTSPTQSTTGRSNSTASSVEVKQELASPSLGAASFVGGMATHTARSTPQCSSPTAMSAITMQQGSNPNFEFAAATSSMHDHLDFPYSLGQKSRSSAFRPLPLQRLQTHVMHPYEESSLSSGSPTSFGNVSDHDYPSPIDQVHTPTEMPFTDSFINSFPDPYSAQHEIRASNAPMSLAIPRSYPAGPSEDLSSSMESELSGFDTISHSPALSSPYGFGPGTPDSFHHSDVASPHMTPQSFDYYGPQPVRSSTVTSNPREDAADVQYSLPAATRGNLPVTTFHQSLSLSPFHHLSLRTQELLEYYDRMICPVLVAFDSPTNPYRHHIMSLAVTDSGLQNAIAALAMNNMRMRQTNEVEMPGSVVRPVQQIRDAMKEAAPEEQHYKATSISILNGQLADPDMAKQDSVLATLLILCLFHVCDTGFSSFKTQLAGVQKLLRMRNSKRHRHGSSQRAFIDWVEMFFTWLDAMNSTVNDRETEIHGDSCDMANLSADLGALEHLAGCEGRLFKLIARLGRLNLLSQDRSVREETEHVKGPRPSSKTSHPRDALESAPRLSQRDPDLTVTNLDYYNLDEKDSHSPSPSEPPNPEPTSNSPVTPQGPASIHDPDGGVIASGLPDQRHHFWKEWILVRSRLDSWKFPTGAAGPHDTIEKLDLANISNAFHASALLYTERLANPALKPSSASLQTHVRSALGYISSISSDSCVNKFLLWPLFIAGTECVEAHDRELVRDRIVGVTKESGFFNNMAGLGLLERLWADDDLERYGGVVAPALPSNQAFRWQRVLEDVPGEYIVV